MVNGCYSSLSSVTSGPKQESVLESLLFVISINNLDINGVVVKCADGTKTSVRYNKESCQSIYQDLDQQQK